MADEQPIVINDRLQAVPRMEYAEGQPRTREILQANEDPEAAARHLRHNRRAVYAATIKRIRDEANTPAFVRLSLFALRERGRVVDEAYDAYLLTYAEDASPDQATFHMEEQLRAVVERESTRLKTKIAKRIEQLAPHWDQVFVHAITERLDPMTVHAWDAHRVGDPPTLTNLTAFLEQEARSALCDQLRLALANADSRPGSKRRPDQPEPKSSTIGQSQNSTHPQSQNRTAWAVACRQCQGEHPLWKCATFCGLPLAKRKQSIFDWKLCLNCLRQRHEASQCIFSACTRCPKNQKHSSVLCPTREANVATVALAAEAPMAKRRKIKAEPKNSVDAAEA